MRYTLKQRVPVLALQQILYIAGNKEIPYKATECEIRENKRRTKLLV